MESQSCCFFFKFYFKIIFSLFHFVVIFYFIYFFSSVISVAMPFRVRSGPLLHKLGPRTQKSSAEVYLPPGMKLLEYSFLFLFCSHIYKKVKYLRKIKTETVAQNIKLIHFFFFFHFRLDMFPPSLLLGGL